MAEDYDPWKDELRSKKEKLKHWVAKQIAKIKDDIPVEFFHEGIMPCRRCDDFETLLYWTLEQVYHQHWHPQPEKAKSPEEELVGAMAEQICQEADGPARDTDTALREAMSINGVSIEEYVANLREEEIEDYLTGPGVTPRRQEDVFNVVREFMEEEKKEIDLIELPPYPHDGKVVFPDDYIELHFKAGDIVSIPGIHKSGYVELVEQTGARRQTVRGAVKRKLESGECGYTVNGELCNGNSIGKDGVILNFPKVGCSATGNLGWTVFTPKYWGIPDTSNSYFIKSLPGGKTVEVYVRDDSPRGKNPVRNVCLPRAGTLRFPDGTEKKVAAGEEIAFPADQGMPTIIFDDYMDMREECSVKAAPMPLKVTFPIDCTLVYGEDGESLTVNSGQVVIIEVHRCRSPLYAVLGSQIDGEKELVKAIFIKATPPGDTEIKIDMETYKMKPEGMKHNGLGIVAIEAMAISAPAEQGVIVTYPEENNAVFVPPGVTFYSPSMLEYPQVRMLTKAEKETKSGSHMSVLHCPPIESKQWIMFPLPGRLIEEGEEDVSFLAGAVLEIHDPRDRNISVILGTKTKGVKERKFQQLDLTLPHVRDAGALIQMPDRRKQKGEDTWSDDKEPDEYLLARITAKDRTYMATYENGQAFIIPMECILFTPIPRLMNLPQVNAVDHTSEEVKKVRVNYNIIECRRKKK